MLSTINTLQWILKYLEDYNGFLDHASWIEDNQWNTYCYVDFFVCLFIVVVVVVVVVVNICTYFFKQSFCPGCSQNYVEIFLDDGMDHLLGLGVIF